MPQKTSNFNIICSSLTDPEIHIAKLHFKHHNIISNLSEIPWRRILHRDLQYLSLPKILWYKSIITFLKRKAIKTLCTSLRQKLFIENISYVIFKIIPSHNIIITPCHHVYEIYRIQCPQMHVIEIVNRFDQTIFNKIVQKKVNSEIKIDLNDGITVFANPISESLLIHYRKTHPRKKIIVRFHDLIEESLIGKREGKNYVYRTMQKLLEDKIIDSVESYCRYDASRLNSIYRPNGVNAEFIKSIDRNFRCFLISFIGSGSPNNNHTNSRIHILNDIIDKLNTIYPNSRKWINTKIVSRSGAWISYNEFLSICVKAEVYIDLIRVNDNEGFSFRLVEALILNRKIITNRQNIKEESFYSPSRIFIIGYDPISRLKDFLESDIPSLEENVVKKFDSSTWWIDVSKTNY